MCVSTIGDKIQKFSMMIFARGFPNLLFASSFARCTDLRSNYRLIRTTVYSYSDCIKHRVKAGACRVGHILLSLGHIFLPRAIFDKVKMISD